jgi:putative aldouronate transport system substrate-binding protein
MPAGWGAGAAACASPAAMPVPSTAAPPTATPAGLVRVGAWTPTFTPANKFSPPVEISTYFPATADFIEGESFTNNPMTRRLEQNLGIKYTIHSQGGWDAYRADIAANNLPDMWNTGVGDVETFIKNDVLEDITDIWEATASPLTKQKKLWPDGKWWSVVRANGRIYGYPFWWGPRYNTDMMWFVRQDWLKKVNLTVPADPTLDDMEMIMKAFVDAGLAQTGISFIGGFLSYVYAIDPIFAAFGAMKGYWLKAEDGSLEYGSLRPGMKDALALLARWYKEGLVDPDFFSKDEGKAGDMVAGEQIGTFFAPFWGYTTGKVWAIEEKQPGTMQAYLLPKGPTGLRGHAAGAYDVGPCVVFKKGTDKRKIEAAIEELNWSIEMHANWLKYQQYGATNNDGAFLEGYEYTWNAAGDELERGTYDTWKYTTQVTAGSYPYNTYPDYQLDVYQEVQRWYEADPETLNAAERFIIQDPKYKLRVKGYFEVIDMKPRLAGYLNEFWGPQSDNYKKLKSELDKLENTAFQEIVIGKRPVDDFDAFVTEWKSTGGDEVAQEVNDWWKTVK